MRYTWRVEIFAATIFFAIEPKTAQCLIDCKLLSVLAFLMLKLVPISIKTIFGFLLRAINLVIAARHDSASRLGTTSTCTALVVKHVNKQHQRFIGFLMNITSEGPNYSTPVLTKGKTLSSNPSLEDLP